MKLTLENQVNAKPSLLLSAECRPTFLRYQQRIILQENPAFVLERQ